MLQSIFLLVLCASVSLGERLQTEDLLIRPLSNGQVMAHFQFENTVSKLGHHFDIFPKPLAELVNRFDVEELRVAFTQGRWQYNSWGVPQVSAPPGAELWALFGNGTKNVDRAWKGLTQGLAGIFCASLQNLDAAQSCAPSMPFHVDGDHHQFSLTNMRYGSLSSEPVCTENLTPWTKLLTCRQNAGLAMLMNPERLFDSSYMSVTLTVRPICNRSGEGRTCATQLVSTITAVLTPENPQSWNISSLFQRDGFTACPTTNDTRITFQLPHGRTFTLTPEPHRIVDLEGGDKQLAVYENLRSLDRPFNVLLKWSENFSYHRLPPPSVTATRYFTGHGHERGGLTVEITNHGASSVTIGYMDLLPWYLRVYFHTHRMTLRDAAGSERALSPAALHFYAARPAEDRVTPSVIELAVDVPAATTLAMTLDFEKAFLRYTEFPPDANRGFDVAAAMVTVLLRNGSAPYSASHWQGGLRVGVDWTPQRPPPAGRDAVMRIYTEPMLISLPTPDFSMPYNVITFTCTVLALFAGSSLNTMLKSLEPQPEQPNLIQRIAIKIRQARERFVQRIRDRFSRRPAPEQ